MIIHIHSNNWRFNRRRRAPMIVELSQHVFGFESRSMQTHFAHVVPGDAETVTTVLKRNYTKGDDK